MQDPQQTPIPRITPFDVPMSPNMSSRRLKWLAKHPIFQDLQPVFRDSPRFEKLLRTHTRMVDCEEGDIVVREGDWGNSAFIVLTGEVAVEIEPPDGFAPIKDLERDSVGGSGLWNSIAQLWRRHPYPEFRRAENYAVENKTMGLRDDGIRAYFQDVPRIIRDFKTISLKKGEWFGELAALGRTARTATVFARTDATQLLEVRWQGLRDLMKADDGLRRRIDKTFRENALRSFLRGSPLLQQVAADKSVMDALVQGAEFRNYGDYDKVSTFRELAAEGFANNLANEPVVACEGDYPNGVILIRSGVARLSHKHHDGHRTLSYLTPGTAYGMEEFLEARETGQSVALKHSLRAIGNLSTVVIPTPLVEAYLFKPGAKRSTRSAAQRSAAQPRVKADEPIMEPEKLAFLVEGGFVTGTATMLINLDRCTRCDDCVRACASTHDNNPRFLRQGPIHGNLMVAHACMHCQDPVCMIECPTGAISRLLDGGVVTINDQTCIGCATCSKNCPYEAIRMVEVRDQQGKFIRATKDQKPITKATKCDLCADSPGGPACQRACPHDAMIRVDMGNVNSVSAWLQR